VVSVLLSAIQLGHLQIGMGDYWVGFVVSELLSAIR
jgi:hypothetical protein